MRTRLVLPRQMACSVPRQVGATDKALWTNVTANATARAASRTKKRYSGLDQPPHTAHRHSPTLTYPLGHDSSFKTGQRVSILILTVDGRMIVPYTGYTRRLALIGHGAHIGAAKLCYDQPHKQFYLLVSRELEVVEPTPAAQRHIVGVDVGQLSYRFGECGTGGSSQRHDLIVQRLQPGSLLAR